MSLATESKIRAGLTLAAALLITVTVIAYRNAVNFADSGRLVAHTREVNESLESLLAAMLDVETGTRGYALTGAETFLEPFGHGIEAAPRKLADVRRLTAGDSSQQIRLDALEPLLRRKIEWSRGQIEVRVKQGAQAAADRTSSLEGKRLMDEIRTRIEEMRKEERDRRDRRIGAWNASERQALLAFSLLVAVAAGLLAAVYFLHRRDGAERRQAMIKLEEARRYAESIVETVREPLLILDAGMRVRTANRAFYETFHAAPRETEGRALFDLGERQWDLPTLKVLLERALLADTPFEGFEVQGEFPAIGHRTMVLDARRIERSAHEGDLVLVSVVDATERKRAQRALFESERRLQAILAHTPAIVYMKDLEGRFLLMNHRFEDLFGIKVEELLGKTVYDFFPKEMAEAYEANDRKAIEGGVPVQVEEVAPQADGLHTYLSLKAPVFDRPGVPYALCGISTDITVLKRTEEELRGAKEAAEATSRELEAFSYSVSHDLRAPLRSIDGFSQALLEDCAPMLDDKARQHLQRVRAASQRMGRLIDDLLDLSRVTRAEMQRGKVDLSRLARAVADNLRRTDPARRVEVEVAEGAIVDGDERLLRVVLENLLGNAWKFTKERPVAHIAFGAMAENGHKAFYVRDDGAGFEMAYAHKLFGAFQRLHAAKEFEGTGIGLATVARIVRRHGGKVWAESDLGKGATFYFTL